MSGLIRSGSLTHYADVARRAGLDPGRMLREFDLPQRCLEDAEIKIPIDAVRRLLEASADRSGVEAFGLLMAEARRLSHLGPLGLLVREQPTLRLAVEAFARYGRRLNESLLLAIEEAGDVVVLREELIVGRAGPVRQSTELAIGVAFRMLSTLLGPDWRPTARVLRARRARGPFGARARVRPQRGVRTRLQRHRVRACRPRSAESQRRSGDGEVCAAVARRELRGLRRRHVDAGAGAGRDAARQRRVHDRTRGAASGRRPADHPPPSRERRTDVFRRSSTPSGGSSPSVT